MQRARTMHTAGFSLIELMIAIAVVGILVSIAYPSYTNFVHRSNRTDATRTMLSDAQALQRCYSQSYTYVGCATVPASTSSPNGYYTIALNVASATSYTLTATPRSAPQTSDSHCAQLQLASSGQQSAMDSSSTTVPVADCWGVAN